VSGPGVVPYWSVLASLLERIERWQK